MECILIERTLLVLLLLLPCTNPRAPGFLCRFCNLAPPSNRLSIHTKSNNQSLAQSCYEASILHPPPPPPPPSTAAFTCRWDRLPFPVQLPPPSMIIIPTSREERVNEALIIAPAVPPQRSLNKATSRSNIRQSAAAQARSRDEGISGEPIRGRSDLLLWRGKAELVWCGQEVGLWLQLAITR